MAASAPLPALPPDLAGPHALCVQGRLLTPSIVKAFIEELAARRTQVATLEAELASIKGAIATAEMK